MSQFDGPEEEILTAEITPDSSLSEIQTFLVDEAHDALHQFTFAARNEHMAKAIGLESSLLAAKSLGLQDHEKIKELTTILTKASTEAGKAFEGAFDQLGKPVPEKQDEYNAAMKKAKEVAYAHLPEALQAAGIVVDISSLLHKADFNDVMHLLSRELRVPMPGMTPEEVKASLHETAKGDYYESKIDSLPMGEKEPLTDEEQKALDIALRMTNATWKAGQVHRAAWEGNDSRIDPAQRGHVFNPYDELHKEQFNDVKQTTDEKGALIKVAFEVYKDKMQYDNLPQLQQAA